MTVTLTATEGSPTPTPAAPPPLYLSRVRLRCDLDDSRVQALLNGVIDARARLGHHLVWLLFGDHPDRQRDYLWREQGPGEYYVLSARPPEDAMGLFEIDPPRQFAPTLRIGDRLAFSLRVHAQVSLGGNKKAGVRGRRRDIVSAALKQQGVLGTPMQAAARARILVPTARAWMSQQGLKHGFSIPMPDEEDEFGWEAEWTDPFKVLAYHDLMLRREGADPMYLKVLDLEGELVVTDPAKLLAIIAHGLGQSKAFGCGLMLIRRAR